MKNHFHKPAAFRRALAGPVLSLFLAASTPGLWAQDEGGKLKARIDTQRAVYTMLTAFAQDNQNAYPNEPGDSNRNFRLLFIRKLVDMEQILAVPGDPWILPGKPDGDIGAAPGFWKAGEAGEVCITYVAGMLRGARSDLPLLLSGADPEATRWITGLSRKPPAKPFTGQVVVTMISGKTVAVTPDADGKIRLPFNGKPTDIFSEAYGIDPANIRLPAEPKTPDKE